jgi:hypothetical protein
LQQAHVEHIVRHRLFDDHLAFGVDRAAVLADLLVDVGLFPAHAASGVIFRRIEPATKAILACFPAVRGVAPQTRARTASAADLVLPKPRPASKSHVSQSPLGIS